MHVTEEEQSQINKLVAAAQAKSGVQVPIAIVARTDAYPEIPWKAFAIGTAFASLLVMAQAFYFADWSSSHAGVLVSAAMVAGASFAALSVVMPAFARLFLAGPPRRSRSAPVRRGCVPAARSLPYA